MGGLWEALERGVMGEVRGGLMPIKSKYSISQSVSSAEGLVSQLNYGIRHVRGSMRIKGLKEEERSIEPEVQIPSSIEAGLSTFETHICTYCNYYKNYNAVRENCN